MSHPTSFPSRVRVGQKQYRLGWASNNTATFPSAKSFTLALLFHTPQLLIALLCPLKYNVLLMVRFEKNRQSGRTWKEIKTGRERGTMATMANEHTIVPRIGLMDVTMVAAGKIILFCFCRN